MANTLILEYLIIIKQEDNFCSSQDAFLKFLTIDERILVSSDKNIISFRTGKTDLVVNYTIITDLVPLKKERYFKFTLECKNSSLINNYYDLSQVLERIFKRIQENASINILWNDIARQYAIEGYSAINEVENLLRRLITNFMLINVGYDWHKSHIPLEVENRDGNQKGNYADYLHQTYFSDLKTILFEGQRETGFRNIGDVQLYIQRCLSSKIEIIKVDELKGIIAISLWEKYFSNDTSYKKEQLELDLDRLNSLRNHIAHNRHIDKPTLGQINNISKKIIKTLKLELERLPETKLSAEEQILEIINVKSHISKSLFNMGILAEQFIKDWYSSKYTNQMVIIGNDVLNDPTDFIIKLNHKSIGVLVKSMRTSNFRQFKRLYLSDERQRRLHLVGSMGFSEYHIAIHLNDYSKDNGAIIVDEDVIQTIRKYNANVKLIVGFINADGKFETLIDQSLE